MKLTETKQNLHLSGLAETVLSNIVKILEGICDLSYLSPSMYFADTSRNVHVFQWVFLLHTFYWLLCSMTPSTAPNFISTWQFRTLRTPLSNKRSIQVQRKEPLSQMAYSIPTLIHRNDSSICWVVRGCSERNTKRLWYCLPNEWGAWNEGTSFLKFTSSYSIFWRNSLRDKRSTLEVYSKRSMS